MLLLLPRVRESVTTDVLNLDSVITNEGSKPEILSRIAQTTAALTRLKPVWMTVLSVPRYN